MKRTYVGELEWALQEVNKYYRSDTHPHRQARIGAAVRYGLAVAIARREREPIPGRPDMEKAI